MVETTLLYIQLAEVIFKDTTDEFTVEVANKAEEIQALPEVDLNTSARKMGCSTLGNVNKPRIKWWKRGKSSENSGFW